MAEATLVSVISAQMRDRAARPAQRHKVEGQWLDLSYGELAERVAEIAAGLTGLGLRAGDRVALLANNSITWAHGDLGILFAGGVTVTIYPTSIPREIAYILDNSDARFLLVEDDLQLQKVRDARHGLPLLEKAVVMSGPLRADDFAMSLTSLRESGRRRLAARPVTSADTDERRADDVAAIIYTSGTTGPPKGVMLSHRNILFVIETIAANLPDIASFQTSLSFLPLSHALERIGGHFLPLCLGRTIAYAESLDQVGENFREVQPDLAIAVPRVFEKVYRRILDQVQHAPPLRRKIFHWAVGVGRQAIAYLHDRRPLPRAIAWRHRIADRLVYRQIRAVLGGRLKFFVSGGAPLAADIAEFFSAIGVKVFEGWGATESSAPATLNRPGQIRIGSVGRPLPGIEVRLLDDGELLIRGPSVCLGYWKMPEQTAETFDADGWYHTGDIGRIDADGYVYITDRKKELIITAAGKNISPQNIENKLKLSPYIANALAFGDRRPYLTALITLDVEAVAKVIGATDKSHATLAQSAAVQQLIEDEMTRVNEDLPRFEQIKKFRIPPADFSVEADELSPSLKLKRKNVVARYQALIDAMYEENEPA